MPVKTKRWNDPIAPDDGYRVLVTRYRPRALRRERENWEAWSKQLAPSVALHSAAYGKSAPAITFAEYRERYLAEMAGQRGTITNLAERVRRGETVTLLCSSACTDAAECHRTLLKELIEAELPVELHTPPEKARPEVVPAKFSRLSEWLK
jgi:uncharacterized protein YeaO (DUF488 family)